MENLIVELEQLEIDQDQITPEEFLELTNEDGDRLMRFREFVNNIDNYNPGQLNALEQFLEVISNGGTIDGFPMNINYGKQNSIYMNLATSGAASNLHVRIESCYSIQNLVYNIFYYSKPLGFKLSELMETINKYRPLISTE